MATTDGESKRTLRRLYRNRGEQEPTKKLSPDVQYVILETVKGGHRVEADMETLFPAGLPPPCMGLAATAFGLNTVLGNEIAGKDKEDPAALIALIEERWGAIQDGEWSEGRQGPRIKDVLNAWAADARDRGKQVSDESFEKMRSRLTSGEVATSDLLNIPSINAHYQKAKAEKAVAAFEDAKAKAAGATGGTVYDPD